MLVDELLGHADRDRAVPGWVPTAGAFLTAEDIVLDRRPIVLIGIRFGDVEGDQGDDPGIGR